MQPDGSSFESFSVRICFSIKQNISLYRFFHLLFAGVTRSESSVFISANPQFSVLSHQLTSCALSSINLLFGLPQGLLPGSSTPNTLLPMYSLSFLVSLSSSFILIQTILDLADLAEALSEKHYL